MMAVFAWSIVPGSAQISDAVAEERVEQRLDRELHDGHVALAGHEHAHLHPAPHRAEERRAHATVGHEVRVGDVDALASRRVMRTRYSRWMLRRVRHWLASTQTGRDALARERRARRAAGPRA